MIEIGCIVRSTAGRDQGRFLVVLALEGEYAFLADGKVRRITKPKKKKQKHLEDVGQVVELSKITSDKKLKRVLYDLGFHTR